MVEVAQEVVKVILVHSSGETWDQLLTALDPEVVAADKAEADKVVQEEYQLDRWMYQVLDSSSMIERVCLMLCTEQVKVEPYPKAICDFKHKEEYQLLLPTIKWMRAQVVSIQIKFC